MRRRRGRKYLAPEALRGRSVTLSDGRRLDIAADGTVHLAAAGAHRGAGPRVEALSLHRQLVEAGFVLGEPDTAEEPPCRRG